MSSCKNCNTDIKVEDKFCPNCGQKNIERLRVKVLLGELANAFLAWDSKLINSLKPLLLKPGTLSRNYIQGKRKSYVAPLRMYLFVSIVFFAVLSFMGRSGGEDGSSMVDFTMTGDTNVVTNDSLYLMVKHNQLDDLDAIQDMNSELTKTLMKKVIEISVDNGGDVTSFFIKNLSIMYFFFIPIFAWLLKLFYRKNNLDYIEHLVYGLYFHSFMFLVLLLSFVLTSIFDQGWPFLLAGLGIIIYLIQGMKSFYEASTGMVILKGVFMSLIYAAIFVGFAIATLFLTIWFY